MSNSLPENAHPAHLKKQAKALLRSCQASKPDALRRFTQHHPVYANRIPAPDRVRLQQAQHVLACEYGFSSWAHLMEIFEPKNQLDKPDDSGILLFTNGKSSLELFRQVKLPGRMEEWVDVLHDGPVPLTSSVQDLNKIRAKYLSDLGWAGYDGLLSQFESRDQLLSFPNDFSFLQLWFEHDLFDQLLLVQLLARIALNPAWIPKTTLWQFDTYIGRLSPEKFVDARPNPISLRPEHLEEATRIWQAFREPDPSSLTKWMRASTGIFPYLQTAILRFCEEFPSVENGCGRTEQQILEAVQTGHQNPPEIFRYNQGREEAVFMGDASFYLRMENLTQGRFPLLKLENSSTFLHPGSSGYSEAFRCQRFVLTGWGEKVLNRQYDRLQNLVTPYWRGGCEIKGPAAPRWDAENNKMRY